MNAKVSRTKSNLLSASARASISPPPTKKRRRSSSQDQVIESLEKSDATTSSTAPPTPLPANAIRIFAWNINGISSFLQTSIAGFFQKTNRSSPGAESIVKHSLRDFFKRNQWPQIVNLQEVKINPSDEATKRAVKTAINRNRNDPGDDGPEYDVRFCLPSDRSNARGFGRKVYGVATIIRKDFLDQEVIQCREVDWDVEGRVLVVETKLNHAIFNIYAVNGTDNPYKDPVTGHVVGTRHDRKLAFHRRLLEECQRLERLGWFVILTGDLNISPQPIDGYPKLRTHPEQHVRNRADYNSKFLDAQNQDGLRAVDSFRHLHPNSKKYTWINTTKPWLESCDRVDHILVSRSIVELGAPESEADVSVLANTSSSAPKVTLLEADILMTPADRGPSDHVPLYVTLLCE